MAQGSMITITNDTEFDFESDEYRVFVVAECDDDGDPVGRIRRFDNEGAAIYFARSIARGREVHWE